MRKVVLIRPAVFLHERFESTPILGKIKWRLLREHGISRFAGFLENEIILETLIVIFVNSSPKGLSWPNVKKFDFLVLTLNSRYLQSAALKLLEIKSKFQFSFLSSGKKVIVCKVIFAF